MGFGCGGGNNGFMLILLLLILCGGLGSGNSCGNDYNCGCCQG